MAGESVLLTRDLDGHLHAFANVCRHRGSRLCEEHDASTQGSLMCPYHAWTYALDGRLVATPHLEEGDVDRSSLPLWAYHVREWNGIAFVSVHPDPAPFDEWLDAHAADMLRLARFPISDMQVVATTRCDIAANWKVIIENYQECYHCPSIHPQLCSVSHSESGENYHGERGAWVGGYQDLKEFQEQLQALVQQVKLDLLEPLVQLVQLV